MHDVTHFTLVFFKASLSDGEVDCEDYSDEDQERLGSEACELSRGMFPCEDIQCRDKSDEGAWCGTATAPPSPVTPAVS